MGKTDDMCRLTERLEYNYVKWPSTFGPCSTPFCTNDGRGGGVCAECVEKELGVLVGEYLASTYHIAIRLQHSLYNDMCEKLEE